MRTLPPFLLVLALLLVLAAALPFSGVNESAAAAGGVAARSEFVCPMPGHPQVFRRPGSCPVCGMQLVKRKPGEHRTRVAILAFDGTQLIDFTAPYEVFGDTPLELYTVAATMQPVHLGGGLTITPNYTFANSPDADLLVVPGGNVPLQSAETEAWLRAKAPKARIVLSICNGAFLLAKAGLLDGLTATTTYGRLDQLAQAYPKTKVVRDRRFVDNGRIVTTAGLSAGLDGSLHVVERLFGEKMARKVALDLEYHWQPESSWTRGTAETGSVSGASDRSAGGARKHGLRPYALGPRPRPTTMPGTKLSQFSWRSSAPARMAP